MKKIWKIRKNSEAVSPVIATILMVAITVVLAAVLYVMVMGFNTGSGGNATGALDANKVSATQYRVSLLSITQNNVRNDSVTLIVVPSTGTLTPIPFIHMIGSGATLGAGDYIDIHTTTGVTYTVTIRDNATNNAIATLTFTAS